MRLAAAVAVALVAMRLDRAMRLAVAMRLGEAMRPGAMRLVPAARRPGWLRAAALALLLAGTTLLGAVGQPVAAHAELISSLPGAGQAVAEPPTELTLVFSERLDALGTAADVLDGDGRLVVRSGGEPDPADARRLLVPLPQLTDGLYTVAWRSLSADDGHTAQGFFNFGVGEVSVPGARPPTGDVHAGHGAGTAVLETIARLAAQLGSLLGVGLLGVAFAVARPLGAELQRRALGWTGLAVLAGGAGAAMLLPLAASWSGLAITSYATDTTPGNLLLARAAVGLAGGGATLLLAARRPPMAWAVGGLAAVVLTVLLAASGHSSAFGSPVPILVVAVHVAAAGSWLAGLLLLAWLAIAQGGRRRDLLAPALPRLSAVALVAVGTFALTGAYAAWLMNGRLLDLGSPYGVLLAGKVALAIAALAIGGLNYAGWRVEGRLGLRRRLVPEAGLAIGVVVLTALLASTSPAGPLRPVLIAEATSTAPGRLDATLGLLPGRPGPNRALVTLADPTALRPGSTIELVLSRLDQAGQARIEMQPLAGDPLGATYSSDFLAPPGRRWDASARWLIEGTEQSRARFVFGLGETGLNEGRQMPLLDPLTLLALILGGSAILAATLGLAGWAPPRTHARTARLALLIGAVAAGGLALAALILPPTA